MSLAKALSILLLNLMIGLPALAQELPILSDGILVCTPGALPFYVSCEDSTGCIEKRLYADGQLAAEGRCHSGKKVGMWSSFYPNGQLQSKGIIKDGLLYGPWVFYHENGEKKAEGEFKAGKFELGCAGSGSYRDASIMKGAWRFWYPSGQQRVQCHFSPNTYAQENRHGQYVYWYPDGTKKAAGLYHKGMKNGTWTYWHPNGQKQREELYQYRDCNLYDYIWYECPAGTWRYWNADGSLAKTETYKEGILQNAE